MKKSLLTILCLTMILVSNTGLKAQGITITLDPGWNWIGYPHAVAMGVGEALGVFEPTEGDVIKTDSSYALYEDGGWFGTLTQLMPGCGYLYRSMASETVSFVFAQPSGLVVTTLEPTEITAVSAVVGGDVTLNEGNHIFARGICWGTEPNPDIDGDPIARDAVAGNQSYTLDGLTQGNTYYVRAYVVTDYGLIYGDEQSFTTIEAGGDHEYVDLGLPSGTLWATCNVGASTPEGCGDYFAWGETEPKDIYYWSTYQHANGSSLEDPQYTKYCNNPEFGFNGFTDNLTKLLPVDDAATANLGENWCIPTGSQFEELFNHTTFTSIVSNGVTGFLFTASNGNSIFLPVTGSISYDNVIYGNTGEYWSSTLLEDPNYVSSLFFYSESFGSNIEMANAVRCYGRPIRPVRSAPQNDAPTGAINGKFTINANGDQVYFSQGNLQYQASTDTWRFAENQFDIIGSENSNISETYSGWIDLFGWGTSGWDNGNSYYHPWDWDNSNASFFGPSGEHDLTGEFANSDWGVFNPIQNGGNVAGQWRTLSDIEWNYILRLRNTASGILYAKAQVNNVNGLIILPDDWNENNFNLSNTNSNSGSFSVNTLTASQWTNLENAGAIFLPLAGYRIGKSVQYVGSYLRYWASRCSGSDKAWALTNTDNFISAGNYQNARCFGFSVRLVRDVE